MCFAEEECRLVGTAEAKFLAMLQLLSQVVVHQMVVFCNSKPEGQILAQRLSEAGFPAAFISGKAPFSHTDFHMLSRKHSHTRWRHFD